MMLCEAIQTDTRVPNFGASWSDDDDAQLAALRLQVPELPTETICTALGRSHASVVARLARLRIRRVEGGKMRKCLRHMYCGTVIYSTSAGERLCYSCRQLVRELD